MTLAGPWPVVSNTRFYQRNHQSETIEIWFAPDGRLEVIVLETESEEVLAEERSPVLSVNGEGKGRLHLVITVDGGSGTLTLYVDGNAVKEGDDPLVIEASEDHAQSPAVTTSVDEAGIRSALRARTQRMATYKKVGWSQKHADQRRDDLRQNLRLLEAAVARLQGGDFDEVVSVSALLRKIVGNGKGNHLLQDCAAIESRALHVWIRPPESRRCGFFSSGATNENCHQTDLDVWLNGFGAIIERKELTNSEMLHSISDKIGAHSDPHQREVVDALYDSRVNDRPSLVLYLLSFAYGVIELSRALLASI